VTGMEGRDDAARPGSVLVTGGAGFIGSHTCVELRAHGSEIVVVDNLANSSPVALQRVAALTGGEPVPFYELDLRDYSGLREVFRRHRIDAVIHFAARKAVGESMQMPLEYYDTNVAGTVTLLRAMRDAEVDSIVFSSSCSIYGDASGRRLTETDPAAPTNPYARTKWVCEGMLADACARYGDLRAISLRYFNPTGAHPSGTLGEDPLGVPSNVVPYLMQVATGRRERLSVFGGDYPTPDGTAIRDYLHVVDVADGHRLALEHLGDATGHRVFNLGTGVGTSVLQLVHAFGAACGRTLPYDVVARRPGDVAELVADAARVAAEWGWKAERDLEAMCRDAWEFARTHPRGYSS